MERLLLYSLSAPLAALKAALGVIALLIVGAIVVAVLALPAQRVTPQPHGEAVHSLTGYDAR